MPNIHGTLSSTGTLVGTLNQYGGGGPGTNDYEDLTNLPQINNVTLIGNKTLAQIGIPTVNNATLTIQKNGTNVATFSANASSNATANIVVPTKTSDITNDSGFITASSLATVATSGDYSDLSGTPTLATVATSGLYSDLSGTPTLATVATSGDYDDLIDKPTIPTATSDLNNDSDFQTSSDVSSAITTAIAEIDAVQYDTVNEEFIQASVVIAQFATDEEIIALYD